jgi:hypothetical protein
MGFPEELKNYRAFVCWRLENRGPNNRPTKVPYSPISGREASATDPNTWVSYGEAMAAVHMYDGIGFVLSDNDPFTFIDADNPFKRKDGTIITDQASDEYKLAWEEWERIWSAVHEFGSYAEWSPSKRGFHVIIRGKLPLEWGNRKGKWEVYSRERYMTLTGWHLEGTPETIEPKQYALEQFGRALELDIQNTSTHVSQEATRSDAEVLASCMSASTADKFVPLWNGDISAYPSGSEADLALANFICYFTENTEQAERIFLSSPHYAGRDKLHNRSDLVRRVIDKGFDKKPPPIDVSAMMANHLALEAALKAPVPIFTPEASTEPTYDAAPLLKPDGMLGEIAQFIYDISPRPVAEVSLATAIGFFAGIVGRSHNVNGTGLNQYVALVASSGIGKEIISGAMSKMVSSLANEMPSAAKFIGPSEIASAPGLYKHFQRESFSFVSQIPELGKWLRMHLSDKANANQEGLVRAFLNLYGKSGRGNEVGSMVYSDKDKNVEAINAPAFSFVGETVPGSFWEAITAESITNGLIPRLLIIEHKGERPPMNYAAHTKAVSEDFKAHLKNIFETALTRNNVHTPIDVQVSPEAWELLCEFDRECDTKINRTPHEVIKAIWNRTHLKALKLAALKAVGINWHLPVISVSDAQWGIAFARNNAHVLLARFDVGEISSGDAGDDKERAVLKAIAKYLGLASYPKAPAGYKERGWVPVSYIANFGCKGAAFKSTAYGKDRALIIRGVIDELCKQGALERITDLHCIPAGVTPSKSEAVRVLDNDRLLSVA